MQQITIYREAGRYAGWPANYGIWAWGDEIVVGFTVGYFQGGAHYHTRDRERPFETLQARTLDGGRTWNVQPIPARIPGNRALSSDEHLAPHLHVAPFLDSGPNALEPCPGTVDFTHPDFALLCARTGLRAGARSWFYLSIDRCHTWQGPYGLPLFGQTGVAARTDYLVDGPQQCTLFLTAAKPNGEEGRVFCARTEDGGRSFSFRSWVTPEPEGYTIMPASVRLPSGRILTAVRASESRVSGPARRCWIDLYASDDDGATFGHLSRPVADTGFGGNPPTLTQLADGRLCLVYGFRDPPSAIQAVLSADGGRTWGKPVSLRTGAGNHDLGYPRTVQRPDGKLVTVYYWNDDAQGDRYLAATIWQP